MAIIGHGSEPLQLPDSAFVSEAIGRNDIARSLVGRERINAELATGQNPFPQELPASKKNPQRQLGHDHSGPPFGSALRHCVASWSWQKTSANLQQPSRHLGEGIDGDMGPPRTFEITFWNRPHTALPAPYIAPYSRLFLYVVAHKTAANADLDIDITPVGRGGRDGDTQSESITITNATPVGYKCTTAFLLCSGGRNRVRLEFSSTAVTANRLTLDAWALCQVAKRSHGVSGVP